MIKIIIYNSFNIIAVLYSVTRLTGVPQAMLRTELPLSVGRYCGCHGQQCNMHHSLSRYDYSDVMFSNLCLHKQIVGSDIEGTFIL